MSFSWTTFALQAVNFLVLVWLLKRFLFKPIAAALGKRKLEMDRERAEVQAARQSADQARKDFEARLSQIQAERQSMIDQARAQLADEHTQMVEAARAEIDKLDAAAQKRLAQEREDAVREVSGRAIKIALGIARRLLQQVASPDAEELFFARVLDHLDHLPAAERSELADQLARDGGTLRVITAGPLAGEVQSRWCAQLGRRLGVTPQITFNTDAALIAGVDLNFPHAVLRFSWGNALAEAQSELDRHEQAD